MADKNCGCPTRYDAGDCAGEKMRGIGIGAGTGAAIGGAIAGPPGAVIGALIGG